MGLQVGSPLEPPRTHTYGVTNQPEFGGAGDTAPRIGTWGHYHGGHLALQYDVLLGCHPAEDLQGQSVDLPGHPGCTESDFPGNPSH